MTAAPKYTLDVRPTFVDELDKAIAYIETELCNPVAADRLLADVYDAIDRMLPHPKITRPVFRPPQTKQPYYVIRVRNFEIYYIVHDDVMEVRWFRYGRSQQPLSANPRYRSTNPFEDWVTR